MKTYVFRTYRQKNIIRANDVMIKISGYLQ
jgi:hypothetical protein